jgi:hypothetical protein
VIRTKTVTVRQLNGERDNKLETEIQRQAALGWQMTNLTTVPISYLVGNRSKGQLHTVIFTKQVSPALENLYNRSYE